MTLGSGSVSGSGVAGAPQLLAQLVELLLEALDAGAEIGEREPGRRRPPLHLASIEQRRKRLGDVVEDAAAPFLAGLQLLPAVLHAPQASRARGVAEHCGWRRTSFS